MIWPLERSPIAKLNMRCRPWWQRLTDKFTARGKAAPRPSSKPLCWGAALDTVQAVNPATYSLPTSPALRRRGLFPPCGEPRNGSEEIRNALAGWFREDKEREEFRAYQRARFEEECS